MNLLFAKELLSVFGNNTKKIGNILNKEGGC